MATLNVRLADNLLGDRLPEPCRLGGDELEAPVRQEIDFAGSWLISVIQRLGGARWTHPTPLSLGILLAGWLIPGLLSHLDRLLLPGTSIGNRCFAFDLSMYGCFFVGMPVIIFAEHRVSAILSGVVWFGRTRSFLAIEPEALNREIVKANRQAQSASTNLLALAIALITCLLFGFTLARDGVSTWFAVEHHGSESISLAGLWAMLVSYPLIIYLILIWSLKAISWFLLLKRITRYPVRVNPLHPDKCGGLSFFGRASLTWSFLVIAIGFVTVFDYANYVHIQGASPLRWDLLAKLLGYLILAPFILMGQLAVWTPHLFAARRTCLRELIHFGKLQADALQNRIQTSLRGELNPLDLQADFEGLAGGGEALDRVRSMRLLPFDMVSCLKAVSAVCVPLLPLILPSLPAHAREVISWFVK